MKRTQLRGMISVTARRGAVVAGLVLSIVSCGIAARAQSVPAPAPKIAPAPSPQLAPAVKTAPDAPVSPSSARPPSAVPKGPSEGITVHGHWVIEVRNPDGTVTARREFENALTSGGQSNLATVLGATGNAMGGFSIAINGANLAWVNEAVSYGPPCLPNCTVEEISVPVPQFETSFGIDAGVNNPGPCPSLTFRWPVFEGSNGIGGTQSLGSVTTCLITTGRTSSGYSSWLGFLCSQNVTCSTNLTETNQNSSIILSGSTTSYASGNITDVETILTACDQNSTPKNCINFWNYNDPASSMGFPVAGTNIAAAGIFTEKLLDSQGSDPAPVPYQSNQTIAITVTLSFQ